MCNKNRKQKGEFQQMQKQRIEWIDVAKGIGVFLVVIAHTGIAPFLSEWIGTFHMPLFVFLSGYVYKTKSFGKNLYKCIKTLLLPYFVFSICFMTIDFFVFRNIKELHHSLKNILSGQGTPNVMWFLVMLFWVEILFNLVLQIKQERNQIVLVCFVCIIGYSLCQFYDWNVWNLGTAFVGLIFFASGYMANKNWGERNLFKTKYAMVALLINVLICILNHKLYGSNMDMHGGRYHNLILTIICAYCGCIFIFWVSYQITACKMPLSSICNKILQYVGRNTIWFYPITAWLPPCLYGVLSKLTILKVNGVYKILTKVVGFVGATCCVEIRKRIKRR